MEAEKYLDPYDLLEKFEHPYLYYEFDRERYIFSLLKSKKRNVIKFPSANIQNEEDFIKMLDDIHLFLDSKGISITNCGCAERKEREEEELDYFIRQTIVLFDSDDNDSPRGNGFGYRD